MSIKLSNNQKKYLRSLAHQKKPIIMIGQHGLSNSVREELLSTLDHHELLKIKIRTDDKIDKKVVINDILVLTQSECVQVVGGTLVIYKAFDENPELVLPRN